jgi:copper transport protein
VTDLLGPAYVSARWGFYLAALVVIGASSFAPFFFGDRTAFHRLSPAAAQALRRRAATLGLIGAIALALFAVMRLWLQTRTLLEPEEPLSSEFVQAVLASNWGRGWKRQMAAALAGCVGFGFARKWNTGWGVAVLAALGTALTTGMTGHAATAEAGRAGWVVDAIHVGAGGIWLGGLAIILLAGLPACLTLPESDRRKAHRLLVGLFSSRALVVAPVTVVFGVWLAVEYLGWTWPIAMFGSRYGGALAVKIALVLVVGALGAYNWRIVQPRLEDPDGESRLRRSVTAELLFGLLVLGVTAVLVALPFAEPGR